MTLPAVTDSHCHLDHVLAKYPDLSLETLLEQARSVGVNRLLNVCIELNQFEEVYAATQVCADVYASAGQHPCDCQDSLDIARLHHCVSQDKVIAVGETGLDFFHDTKWIEQQEESFIHHMKAASQFKKPLIIHSRSARCETISLLKQHADLEVGGVLHCFTESWEMAKQALDLGFYISFSGIITFKNADDLREVAKKIPSDRLLIETDAPYLAPVPHRGKANQPAYVTHVGHAMASLRFVDYPSLVELTNANFDRLFFRHVHAKEVL